MRIDASQLQAVIRPADPAEPRLPSVQPGLRPPAPSLQQEGLLKAVVRDLLDWLGGTGISQAGVPAGYTATTKSIDLSLGLIHVCTSVSYTPDSITITLPNGASISATGADAAEVRSLTQRRLRTLFHEGDLREPEGNLFHEGDLCEPEDDWW
ncbi:hypothetical protein JCM4814A_79560 [Streptomyces phaeofaciens JCM 4814]|uniref:Uncharacterized protein n=1 Tax=Streptomyces phaeofaciens TaxID=68254 RepID=A0A918HRJ6_9ACTN|nr:hypothetical protein GCM10010226_83080 [Streptomyces phaeofaciens]